MHGSMPTLPTYNPSLQCIMNLNVNTRYCSLGGVSGTRSYWPLNMVASQHDLIPTTTARAIKFRKTKYRCLYDNFQPQKKKHYISKWHSLIVFLFMGGSYWVIYGMYTDSCDHSEYIAESGVYIWQLVVD